MPTNSKFQIPDPFFPLPTWPGYSLVPRPLPLLSLPLLIVWSSGDTGYGGKLGGPGNEARLGAYKLLKIWGSICILDIHVCTD